MTFTYAGRGVGDVPREKQPGDLKLGDNSILGPNGLRDSGRSERMVTAAPQG